MKISGIYKIVNTINGKLYIGSAKNLETRKDTHFNALSRGNHANKYLLGIKVLLHQKLAKNKFQKNLRFFGKMRNIEL